MSPAKIERNLLEKVTQEFIQQTKQRESDSLLTSKNERQAHFEQNYKKK